MLLLSMRLPVLLFGLADPSDITPLVGRLAPAGPIALFEIALSLFAPPVEVLIRMLPPAVVVLDVDEPSTVHLVMVLFCAPLMSRIVLVPAVAETVVFEIVSELPPELKPSMVTLSAPLRSINGLPATIAPEIGSHSGWRDQNQSVARTPNTARIQNRRCRLGGVAAHANVDDASVGAEVNRIKCVFQRCVVSVISAIGRFNSNVAGPTGDLRQLQKILNLRVLRWRKRTIRRAER